MLDSLDEKRPAVPPKSSRDRFSPHSRTPHTPMSSHASNSLSGSTRNPQISSTSTPIFATEGWISPFPVGLENRGPTLGHYRGQSDTGANWSSSSLHLGEQSEASVVNRGRPRKRSNLCPITHRQSPSRLLADRKAFETLPEGTKAIDVPQRLNKVEIEALKVQAIGQAANFEVLGMKDVESLSKVLIE